MVDEQPTEQPQEQPQEIVDEDLTPEEEVQLHEYMEKYGGFPQYEEKPGVHQLFNEILKRVDTIKSSALDENELMAFRHVRRGSVVMKLFDFPILDKYLKDDGEVITASALSGSKRKPGAFLQAVITQKRELATKIRDGKKSGLFGSKKEE